MDPIWVWVVLGVVIYFGLFYLPALLLKRAILKVIALFCRHHAVGIQNAKTVDELGLSPRDFWQSLMRPRDYKPYALSRLRQAGIVHETDTGKIYMVEDRLDETLRCSRLADV